MSHYLLPYGDNRRIVKLEYRYRQLTMEGRLSSVNLSSRRKRMLGLCEIRISVSKQKFRSSWKRRYKDRLKIF